MRKLDRLDPAQSTKFFSSPHRLRRAQHAPCHQSRYHLSSSSAHLSYLPHILGYHASNLDVRDYLFWHGISSIQGVFTLAWSKNIPLKSFLCSTSSCSSTSDPMNREGKLGLFHLSECAGVLSCVQTVIEAAFIGLR